MDEGLHPRFYRGSLLGRSNCVFHWPDLGLSQYIDVRSSEDLAQVILDTGHFQMT
jgi:hypothetical protein